jgi:hypothetical protein
MKFHLPSFLLGCATGAAVKSLAPRLKPVVLEVVTAGYRIADKVTSGAARRREDLEDLFAEARARARALAGTATPPAGEQAAATGN